MLKILCSFLSFLFCLSSLEPLEKSFQLPLKVQRRGNWDEYFQHTLNAIKPHNTLALAQQYFEIEEKTNGLAVDLGTGTGRDALFLLKNGWKVFALDAEPLSIDILLNRAQNDQLSNLEVEVSFFSEMILPDSVDLINASFSLPFCHPQDFPDCWQNIIQHLVIGGRFAGQLFGNRDEWASDPSQTFHTQEQMFDLFKENFVIEYLQVEEGRLPTAAGPMKHWHLYHIVAKKIK
jgi:tellurite methyltransferase